MKKVTKGMCLLLATVLMLSLFGCATDSKKSSGNKKGESAADMEAYVGTWRGSDHNGTDVVHYLIFDENGYWNVYMNYTTLLRAIKQLPDQLVSFKVFCELQKSDHTGCHYEYVENIAFAEDFFIDENGKMTTGETAEVYYTKVSTHSGEPGEDVVSEARDLFDRALVEANSK